MELQRIVRLCFQKERVEDFRIIFEESRDKIMAFPGCISLVLMKDPEDPRVFYTVSKWDTQEALEAYRSSELFRTTWAKTKALFAAPASAYSMIAV
jgi:quinol monooxygenase YgiN